MTDGWPEPMKEGTVSVTGYPMYYRICGPRDARETVLCMHGGPGGTHDYLQPIADLSRDGYRVVFYDQLGCGRSARITDTSLFTLEHNVLEVEELRRTLDLGRIHLFGSSYGGTLALAYTLAHPEAVRTLTTAGGVADIPFATEEMRRWISELPPPVQAVLHRGQETGQFDTPEYEAAMMEFYRRHVCRLWPWPPPVTYTLDNLSRPVYLYMNGPNEFTIVGTIKDLRFVDRLGAIRAPTLVTGGRYDEVSPRVAEQIARAIPGAELEIFAQSSHMPFWEERTMYLSRFRRFLAAHRETDPAVGNPARPPGPSTNHRPI